MSPNPQEAADLVTFTEESSMENVIFLWSVLVIGDSQRRQTSKMKCFAKIVNG